MSDISLDLKKKQKKAKSLKLLKNIPYTFLSAPAVIYLLLFHYVPMVGLILAFKDYKVTDTIFSAPWCEDLFKHFKFLFNDNDIFNVLRNTILYHLLFMFVLNLLFGAIVALMLYEVKNKYANKLYQTAMLLPNFVSWIAVAFIFYLVLMPTRAGILNQILYALGIGSGEYNVYADKTWWPVIFTIAELWKSVGMASLYYYAALLSIDPCLFEAASLDGAGKFKQIWYISVPELMPMASLVIITQLGGILGSNLDLFYNLPMGASSTPNGAIRSVTDVLSTYLLRCTQGGTVDISRGAAMSLFQGIVGVVLLLVSNGVIRKISPKNAMF